MTTSTTTPDYCLMLHTNHNLSRDERSTLRYECNHETHHNTESLDQAMNLFGGFLGAADGAINSELALEETDPSYSNFHELGASPDVVDHGHSMQHTDIALRTLGQVFGVSHSFLADANSAPPQ